MHSYTYTIPTTIGPVKFGIGRLRSQGLFLTKVVNEPTFGTIVIRVSADS